MVMAMIKPSKDRTDDEPVIPEVPTEFGREVKSNQAGGVSPRSMYLTGPASPRRSGCAPAMDASLIRTPHSLKKGSVMPISSLLRTICPGRARARSVRKPTSRKPRLELLVDRNLLSPGITLSTTSWTPIGPAPIVNGQDPGGFPVSGRIATVAADPTHANTIYIGAAGGGVWKTTDGGTTWSPLTDNQATLSMGAIALAPSNPNILYAGTGEPDNIGDSYYGRGILKSTDAGATWTLLTGNAGVNE